MMSCVPNMPAGGIKSLFMPKTLAVLLITLVISVLGIALAYLVGQRTAEFRMREEMERSRLDRQSILDELRRDLTPPPAETAANPPIEYPVVANLPEETMPAPEPTVETPDAAPIATAKPETETAIDSDTSVSAEPSVPEPSPEPAAPAPQEEVPAVVAEESPALASTSAPVPPQAPAITRESFDTIPVGTPYTDVALLFGRDGLAALTMEDASGTETRQVFWDWIGDAGQVCRVTMLFVNGRLTDKDYRE